VLTALLLGALTAAGSPAGAQGASFARLAKVWGNEVTLTVRGSTVAQDAEAGTDLEPGDEVRTGESSGAEVLISSTGIVSVRENSVFRLEAPSAGATELRMDRGALLLRWRPSGQSSSLQVRTPNAVAAVRGTEFAVESEGGDAPTTVGVFEEGRVAASNDAGEVELGPGTETTCAAGAAPEAPRPLRVMLKYRATMRALRGRLAALQREYRRLPAEKQRELRRGRREQGR